jgi:hypothetical protein
MNCQSLKKENVDLSRRTESNSDYNVRLIFIDKNSLLQCEIEYDMTMCRHSSVYQNIYKSTILKKIRSG